MAAPEPQPTAPTTSYTPVLTDLLRLVRAPFVPRGVFEEQRDKPTFWMPWIVLSVIFGVIMFFTLPIAVRAAGVAAEARGTPLPPAALGTIKFFTIIAPVVLLLIGTLIGAVVLYFLVMVVGGSARFKGLMCIQIFSSTTVVLMTAVTTAMVRMRGLDAIQSPLDAQQSLGLDLMMSPEFNQAHRALAALLRGIGPFPIWQLVVCAIGLMALEKLPNKKAWTAAILAFVVGLLLQAGAALLFAGRAAAG